MNTDFVMSEWQLAMIFISDKVMSENHWRIASSGTGFVMSYLSIALAHENWRKGDLVNNIREYQFSPPDIHGLACKKIKFLLHYWHFVSAIHCWSMDPSYKETI